MTPSLMFVQSPLCTVTNNGGVTHVATDHVSVRSSSGSSSNSWHIEEQRVEPEDLDHRSTYWCMAPVVKVARRAEDNETLFSTVSKPARTIISNELEDLHWLFERHFDCWEREGSAMDQGRYHDHCRSVGIHHPSTMVFFSGLACAHASMCMVPTPSL